MSTIFFTTFTPPSGTAGPEVVGWPPTRSGCDAPEISGTSVRHREPGLANNETGYGSICKPPAGWAGLSARLPAWASAGGNHRLAGCRAPRPSPGLGGNRLSNGCAVAGSAWSADSPVAADAPPAGPAPGLRHRRAPRASTDPGV